MAQAPVDPSDLVRQLQELRAKVEKLEARRGVRRFATVDRPAASELEGAIIYNTTTARHEASDGANWLDFGAFTPWSPPAAMPWATAFGAGFASPEWRGSLTPEGLRIVQFRGRGKMDATSVANGVNREALLLPAPWFPAGGVVAAVQSLTGVGGTASFQLNSAGFLEWILGGDAKVWFSLEGCSCVF